MRRKWLSIISTSPAGMLAWVISIVVQRRPHTTHLRRLRQDPPVLGRESSTADFSPQQMATSSSVGRAGLVTSDVSPQVLRALSPAFPQ